MHYSLRMFEESQVAQERLKIIQFYEHYGEKATREAFGTDRKVISRWRQRLKESGGRLSALVPLSTRPNRIRYSTIPVAIVDFIREMRAKHPRLGKEKLKPLLDRHCKEKGISPVSQSTIGNIIKRHRLSALPRGRVYHNPDSRWAERPRRRKKRLKVKHPLRPDSFGHIVADTVELVTNGLKDYFYSAIDARGKFALTLSYKRLTSRNMKEFYQRFRQVYPGRIKSWQTDNGREFLGEFDDQLQRDGIVHYFSYPRCPKINTYIERYNRTIQEEFIEYNLDVIDNKPLFNRRLADYLIFYNTQRPHKSLGLKSPMEYLIENTQMSQMYLTYTDY